MPGIEIAQISALVIFIANGALFASLIALKTIHRRRRAAHDRRRSEYVALLSRHIVFEHCTDPMTQEMTSDPAFLDALIDVRNAVVGPEIDTLHGIVNRHGVIERQVRRLNSPFPLGRRLRAAVALAEIGDESAAPHLIERLADREPEIRIQAARGLGRMKWEPAIEAIVAELSRESPWVKARYADTLVGYGARATTPLVEYVESRHLSETAGPVTAIRALGAIGDLNAVDPLIAVLDDAEDVEILIATIETLGLMGSPAAAPAIRGRAASSDWRVRAKAMTALGDLADEASLELLARSLSDENWWVRRNSAASLTQIPDGVDRLYAALAGTDSFAADAAAEVLVDAGLLGEAREREAAGRLEPRDRELIEYLAGAPS